MTKLMKSSNFSPSAGVKHKDDVQLANSPSVDGGTFKAPKNGIMSRAEFEARTSLTVLKQFGPALNKQRNNKVS